MNRKIKALGVVMASVFAISAMSASAASAAEFHSAVHPQALHGSQTVGHVLTTDAGTLTCQTVTFTGTTSALTSPTQTLAPDYSNCKFAGFFVSVHENGCDYLFNANGTTEIKCPTVNGVKQKIEITAPFCTTTIGEQHIASGMSFTNNAGETDIIATANIKSEIDYNECGTLRTNGSYKGITTVTGASGNVWYT